MSYDVRGKTALVTGANRGIGKAIAMADDAGLTEAAEPPEVVAEAIVASLKAGQFHCFPDTMAKQIGEAYESFAQDVVEADMSKG